MKSRETAEYHRQEQIDLLAILQKSLDRALFLYNFTRKVLLSGVKASITIVEIRKFYKISFDSDSFQNS